MSRFQFLEQVLRRWNLLVVGYSGSDDFDIVSTIAGTESTKRLLWVDHHSRSDQEVIMQEREALQNKFARFEADVVSIRACRLRSKHDPNVHLEMLIESFNDAGYSRPLRGKQKRELKKMASELDVLRAKLTTQDEVTALRLKAWITAKLEGLGEAHRFFEQSAQLAHKNNMQAAELLTLTDWRRYYYASFSSGEFIDTQVILLGYPLNFLVIIEGRIRELANLSGFLPVETCCHA